MFKIKIFTIGKTKDSYLLKQIAEYEKRLKSQVNCTWFFLRDNKALDKKLSLEKFFICLDEKGILLNSKDFSKKILHFLEKLNSISFVIGGSDGIPDQIKQKSNYLISLSKLTFPHQIARLLFIEQIYRSLEIAKSSNYHK